MPHTSRTNFSSKMADMQSENLTLSSLLLTSKDAINAYKQEINELTGVTNLLRTEIVRMAKYARLLSQELNNTRFAMDANDPEITTSVDDHLPRLDARLIVQRTTVLIGIAINRARGLTVYDRNRRTEMDKLLSSIKLSQSPLQLAKHVRREMYIVGDRMTADEEDDVIEHNEGFEMSRCEYEPDEIYDGIDTTELPNV